MKRSIVVVSLGLAVVFAAGIFLALFSTRNQPSQQRVATAAGPAAAARVTNEPAAASRSTQHAAGNPPSREFDLSLNPYAGALREPGKSKRAWDPNFLKQFTNAASGASIRFELTAGRVASGTIQITQYRDGELTYLSGQLTEPEPGKFFFLTPPPGGKAGKAVGIVEFPASRTAYRIEPTGPNGDPELWQRRLDEVLCIDLPVKLAAGADTNHTADMPPLRPDLEALYAPAYNSNIVSLQSYPGSSAVLLLDFFGGYTPTWGGIAYSKPANVNNYTIRDVWKRVAEDYMPFNINVTTDIKVYLAAPAASRQRCCYTDTPVTAAGVAYIGSWNWGNDTPCWSVYTTDKPAAEVGAHEPGHTLGLGHQGTSTEEYYAGQGSGATGWAPTMGVGYYQPLSTWSKGEYQNANNTQDELAVITTGNNNVTYRPDDTGSALATSRYLEFDTNSFASAEGVIERSGDTDAFQFTTTGGQMMLAANPVGDWASLAVMVTLADASDTVIASNNPQDFIYAAISTNLPAGTYTFRVTGAGRNNALTNGFSNYPSLGYYSVAGYVAGALPPTRLSVFEHSPNGTTVGTVSSTNSGSALAYAITKGNTNSTFTIDNTGLLQVANNTLLDYNQLGTNSATIAVQFELFINITNLDNPSLTETNRRVVVAVLKQGANYPIAVSGFNAGVIAPCNATPTAPKASGFDIPNNYSFYQAGLNANPQAGSGGGGQGLPANGFLLSQVDNTTFQFGPYGGNNVLLLGNTKPRFGTLTLATPRAYNSLAILASSANGGGLGTFSLLFTNGARSQVFNLNAQDWYNTTTNVAAQGFGRLKLGQSTLNTENPGWNNPNLYQTTINLAALGLNLPVASINFTNSGTASGLTCGIFALSGSEMPPAVNIAQQPQSVTNSVPSQGASFSVVAMGAPTLWYQWYYSSNGAPGSFSALVGKTASTLTLGAVLQPTNAGSYLVVVTNSTSVATSAVATLTLFRAPVITRQPAPANLVLFSGLTNIFSVAANAASPVTYSWTFNGTPIPGAIATNLALNNLQVTNSGAYAVVISNAFGAVTSSPVSLTVLAAPNYPFGQAVLADHAIGYWRLDETSGTIARDSISGRDGIYNRVLLGQNGNTVIDTHRAARFGSLAANTSLVTNIPIDFATPALGNANFSIEAWVNGGSQSSDAGLVSKGTGAGGEQFNLDCGGGSHAFRFFVRDVSGTVHSAAGSVAPNNQWHHLVGVCDEAHTNVILYVDGVQAAQTTIPPGSGLLASANPMTIGCRQSGTGTYDLQFAGLMEEVAVYNYALSASQVQAHYAVVTNRPPYFVADPFTKPSASASQFYSSSIAMNAIEPNGNVITFSKISGPAWLSVASNGNLSGQPSNADAGLNSFTVRAADPAGLYTQATLNITVIATPITAGMGFQGSSLLLNWTGGSGPFAVQMTTNLANPNWQTVASGLASTNLTITPSNVNAFYRVIGQ